MIELQGLCKRYGNLTAVDNLSLQVAAGEVLGLIGPNGAGKTTTIRMLATLLRPDAGTAIIDGLDIIKDSNRVRSRVGYMPDFFGLYDHMQVWEYLDFFACAHDIPYRQRHDLIGNVLELVDLAPYREAFLETLSRGMKQRLCLAMTLLHDPPVLLLDEPASGLDPRSRVEMRHFLHELASLGKTIIISSHILTELAELCARVAVIERGRLALEGSMAEIARRLNGGGRRLTIRLPERRQEARDFLAACPEVSSAEIVGENVLAVYQGEENIQEKLLAALFNHGFRIQSFAEEQSSLEDLYMRAVQDTEGGR